MASTPTLWGEFLYKEISVQPNPSFPALWGQDTTSWNVDDLENKHSPYNDAKWNADANTKKRKKVAWAILRGLASREQRDANPRGMTQRKTKKRKTLRPFRVGGRPVNNGTPTHAEWHKTWNRNTIDCNKNMIDFNEKMIDLNKKMMDFD